MSFRIGIDIESISDIKTAVEKHSRFLKEILTESERKQLNQRKGASYYAYAASRFSAKESYAKATGFGIGSHAKFQDIEILDDQYGKPVITVFRESRIAHAKKCQVSISHKLKLDLVATEVLIEVEDGNSNS